MTLVGEILWGLTVLIITCVITYKVGYDAGYKQATNDVRKRVKK